MTNLNKIKIAFNALPSHRNKLTGAALSFFQANNEHTGKKKNYYTRHSERSFCWFFSIMKNHHNFFFNSLINSSIKSCCQPPVNSGTACTACTVGSCVFGPKAPGTKAGVCTWSNRAAFLYICFLCSCKKILSTSSQSTPPCLLVFPLFLLKIIPHVIFIQVSCLLVNGKYICPRQFL